MEPFNIDAEITSSLEDLTAEELDNLAASQQESQGPGPINDERIELYIYVHYLIFKKTLQTSHLEQAVRRTEGWIAELAVDHPDRQRRLHILDFLSAWMNQFNLISESNTMPYTVLSNILSFLEISRNAQVAVELAQKYRQTGVLETLNEAISIMQRSVELAGEYVTAETLNNLEVMLGTRFDRTGSIDDLNRAVAAAEMAVDATPQDHPNRAGRLSNLGNHLGTRFDRIGSMNDLNRAIEVTGLAINATLQDHPDQAGCLNNLGNWLGTRFNRTGSMDDLNRAIKAAEMAVDATPQDHPNRAGRLSNLGNHLGARFNRTGLIDNLNRAIEATKMAVNTTPQDHPDRAGRLNNLGNRLGTRFQRTGSIDDLNRAIEVTGMAVDTTPQDHPDRASCLNNLGNWLGTRFDRTGSIDDLNRAVEAAGMAVDATPQDHPDRAGCLNNLGNRLGTRFDRTGSIDDLNRAIEVIEIAINTTPQDHPDRSGRLNNLGIWLGTRFDRTGSMDDLNRAVEVVGMAVDATPQDHPNRAACLNNLGNSLGTRFDRIGLMNDLNQAVEAIGMAINATPQDHPDRAGRLNNLGNRLGTRFQRTGSIDDLNRAIEVIEIAINTTPQDHPDRAGCLNNLGNRLGTRFDQTGSIDDLNRAIEVIEIAINTTPQDHPDRSGRLNNLGSWLGTRFDRTGLINDLNRAIEAAEMAVDTMPQDHPNRAACLKTLGNRLGTRFQRTGSIDDLNRALSSYKEGWNCNTAPPSLRIRLAMNAARILASQRDWDQSSSLLDDAIKLLPLVSPRSLAHTDKQSMLAEFAGLASMAAAVSLSAGRDVYRTLQSLELGRGVIAGLLMDMRGDISSLRERHPDLAEEFVSLRDALDSPVDRSTSSLSTDNMPSLKSQAQSRYELDRRFTELIAAIRTKPGFDNFLLPPTETEMKNAACSGPVVVVNLSPYRCDAFLVERHQISVLKLPNLALSDVRSETRNLGSRQRASLPINETLEWLWDAVCRPILDALGIDRPISSDGSWPRVWWVPTGVLSQFPLHAAGYHEQGSTQTVLDRAMSSYASSIKALIHGRRQHVRASAGPDADYALLVAMKHTPGLVANQFLPSVEDEVESLKALCPSLRLKPITPALLKDDVLKHMQGCKVFHFAGHGSSHPTEPSQSYLLLEDWKTRPLTVGDVRDCRFHDEPPFLGYLSACLTGANEAEELADEGIHLVSSFQLAGFRHVIGALWEVSDRHCVDVARVFYETMRDHGMTDEMVCRGLHIALRTLRDKQMEKAEVRNVTLLAAGGMTGFDWVPYIHFGV